VSHNAKSLGVKKREEQTMKDSWESGDPYEYYMGRWSRLVAESFVDWLSPSSGLNWLDIGCGSGALSEAIINNYAPAALTAIDQSEDFVRTAQQRLGSRAHCRVGNALSLPLDNSSVNIAVSGLVLNFIPEPEKALSEMRRVTDVGGTVAVYLWDYAGKMDFLRHFWDAAVEIKPAALNLHESKRFPDSNAQALKRLFENAGFVDIETTSIEITTHFRDFDDYWKPFLGGQGPAPSFLLSLDEDEKNKLRNKLKARLPTQLDGSISMVARAWAAKGQVSQ
jgi:ubiquinone/menaquinone biosynthesis C-methylase UbiE